MISHFHFVIMNGRVAVLYLVSILPTVAIPHIIILLILVSVDAYLYHCTTIQINIFATKFYAEESG